METHRLPKGFLSACLDAVDEYKARYGYKPKEIRLRRPFYEGLQHEFEKITNSRHGLKKIQGVEITMTSLIYQHDMEVV